MSLAALQVPRLLWRAGVRFFKDGCLDLAAAVAFYSLLALVPSLYLLGVVAGRILPITDPTGAALARMADFVPVDAAAILVRLGERLPRPGETVAVAIPILVWIATTAFTTLEGAINVAFGTVPERKYWLSRLKAFAGASTVTILLLVSLLANHAAAWLERVRSRVGLPPAFGAGVRWLSYVVMLLVAYATFTTFYKMLPRGIVRWSAAATGGAFALALWEAARRVFGWFLLQSPTFGLLTGTLAGIVALLLWVYTAVAICLYGAEIASILDGRRGGGRLSHGSRPRAGARAPVP